MEINLRFGIHNTIFVLSSLSLTYAEYCIEYGHSCTEPHKCCGQECCIHGNLEDHYRDHLRRSVWNMWYFWFVVLFVLMSCFGGCSYYRRHQLLMARQQNIMSGTEESYPSWRFSPSFPVSLFSGYGGRRSHQRVSRVERPDNTQHVVPSTPMFQPVPAAVFPSPPAYSEVMSQPDVYPPQKDPELPPYPGPQGYCPSALPPYGSQMVQLPPYTPSAVSLAATYNNNQSTHPTGGTGGTHPTGGTGGTRPTGGTPDNNGTHTAGVAPPNEQSQGTRYDCTTQTVSGIPGS